MTLSKLSKPKAPERAAQFAGPRAPYKGQFEFVLRSPELPVERIVFSSHGCQGLEDHDEAADYPWFRGHYGNRCRVYRLGRLHRE
jgi:hypothetical protein